MKTYKLNCLLVLFAALIFLSSCGSDDEPSVGGTDNLIGLWTTTSSNIEFDVEGQSVSDFLIAAGVPESQVAVLLGFLEDDFDDAFMGTIEFKSDNTFTSNFDDDVENGTWTLNGSTLTIDPELDDPVATEVITLNATSLVLLISETETDDLDGDGTDDTLTVDVTLTLAK